MSIEVRMGKNKAEFLILEDDLLRIKKWKTSIDAKVYKQQMESGKLGERKLPEYIAKNMKWRAADTAEKKPYYGCIGIGYIYKWRFTGSGSFLKVMSLATKDSFEINSAAEKKKEKKTIMFVLSSEETRRMIKWKSTDEGQGEENDYLYEFCPTDIGCFSIIRNLKTGSQIDLTDIESL